MKSSKITTLLALSLMIASCTEQPQSRGGEKSYSTLTVSRSDTNIESRYSASIRGEQFVDIRPQVSGVITNILIEEGAQITRGESLFVIDQVPYKAALDVAVASVASAKSSVATAKLNAESSRELFDEGVISNNELQIALNTLSSAEAALALAQAQEVSAHNNLSYTVVKSPVDGVASMINYRVGALVNSSIADPLVSVTNNKNMFAYFSMSESQMLNLMQASGSEEALMADMADVELLLSNGTKYAHSGRVDAISGTVDRTTGSVSMRAIFENPESMLRDGGSGSITISNFMDDVIVIPKLATFEIQNKIFVYRVVDGVAASSQIEVYPYNNGRDYIVESGIEVGDVIIAEGAGLIREGTEIVNTVNKGEE